jgi:hypothetical protein
MINFYYVVLFIDKLNIVYMQYMYYEWKKFRKHVQTMFIVSLCFIVFLALVLFSDEQIVRFSEFSACEWRLNVVWK